MLRTLYRERLRPKGYLTNLVKARSGNRVVAGPFRGMRYIEAAPVSRLLGTYERELHSIIQTIIDRQPSAIVDVGAAEGYYAVGLARRLPGARIIAFETDAVERGRLSEMLALNAVQDRVSIGGLCDPDALQAALSELAADVVPIVIIDAEGAERDLVDPLAVPGLCRSELLIETHEFIHAGITDQISERLKDTHKITVVHQAGRGFAEFPYETLYTALLPRRSIERILDERRPCQMTWLHCRPNAPELI